MTQNYIGDLICAEANRWIEVRENGYNKGREVEMFQKVIGGANGESWCMSFVQFVAKQVIAQVGGLKSQAKLYATEGCLDLWNHTPDYYKSQVGGRGMIAIFQHGTTTKGHTGICMDSGKVFFHTVEGNTNKAGSREGDGVYEKTRYMVSAGSLKLKGFVDLPQIIYDMLPLDKRTTKAV